MRSLVLAFVMLPTLAACSGGGASTSLTPAPDASGGGVREIAVKTTDALRFEPHRYEIRAGETVRFVVTNAGAVRHEFFVGTEEEQAEHEAEMAEHGMGHDEPMGVSVEPGATDELEVTFSQAGELLVGCHEPGHYAGGMRATIVVGE